MSIRQARKLHVLEEVTWGRMTHREASAPSGLSVRQIQRIKASFKEAGASSLVHGNAGRKPSHDVFPAVRNLVADRARSLWKEASAKGLSELLLAEEGGSVSSKTITRILKEAGLKSPLSPKGARKRKRRARMERFGQMLQIDASPFDWLSKGSMISLHGAIDDGTGNVTALHFEPTECLDGSFPVLGKTVLPYGVARSIDSDAQQMKGRHPCLLSPDRVLPLSCAEELLRKMTGDSTLSWKNRKWAAVGKQDRKVLFRRGTEVEVLTLLDGPALRHGGLCYRLVESDEDKARKDVEEGSGVKVKTGKAPVPASDHAWRKGCGKRPNPRGQFLSVTAVTKEG